MFKNLNWKLIKELFGGWIVLRLVKIQSEYKAYILAFKSHFKNIPFEHKLKGKYCVAWIVKGNFDIVTFKYIRKDQSLIVLFYVKLVLLRFDIWQKCLILKNNRLKLTQYGI